MIGDIYIYILIYGYDIYIIISNYIYIYKLDDFPIDFPVLSKCSMKSLKLPSTRPHGRWRCGRHAAVTAVTALGPVCWREVGEAREMAKPGLRRRWENGGKTMVFENDHL
jgi:hypothetical protein